MASACVAPRPPALSSRVRRPAFAAPQVTQIATRALPARPTLTIVHAHGGGGGDCPACDAGAGTAAVGTPSAKRSGGIFETIGGAEGVRAAVDIFYQKVLADPEVSHYFSGVDMVKQKSKQMAFMAFVFGGPAAYRGRDMRTAHQHLPGLSQRHFDAIKGHFAETLQELGVAQEVIEEAGAVVESTRSQFTLLDN